MGDILMDIYGGIKTEDYLQVGLAIKVKVYCYISD